MVEAAERLQPRDVQDHQRSVLQRDELLGAQALEHPVHVDVGQSHGVGNLDLREGQIVGAVAREPHSLQTQQELAQQVGDALLGGSCADVDQPLAQRRLVHQRAPPQGPGQRRPLGHLQDARPGDVHHPARRQRGDVVVHGAQDEYVQVAEVARDQVGHDLAAAVGQQLVAAGEALEDQIHVRGIIAFPDQVLTLAYEAGSLDSLVEEAPVGLR